MSHMYIMAYDDMFRSDSTIFRSIRAIYHATYSSKCAIAHFDEYVAWYIALMDLKMVESDRNMSS